MQNGQRLDDYSVADYRFIKRSRPNEKAG